MASLNSRQTVAQLAVAQATRARDPELGKAARQRREQVTQAKRRWNEALAAQTQLRDKPDDPTLNFVYGQFLCFQKQAWQDGRAYLAKGTNAALRLAAQQDLLDPTDPVRQFEVANAWFAAADSVDRNDQAAVVERCLYWARRAVPTLHWA